ncbi:hypothetical protein CCAX7_57400 [Capsulimonas corticalis]|uniref:Uncharacterized protein n=1 Tax=Capsulimonas corticalis TaxID=2219043 RepID=A0A402D0D8_9BACT|nr:diguanylate cyclase [Capsulimonas corticalis]BDI33689.1 hypothetical protein CCAX7_57400 [Capsulimonas corticalis]
MTVDLSKDESARLAALREYRILDTDAEETYDAITRLAAFICDAPIAAVTLVDAERQWFKSILGVAVKETPRSIAFCSHTIQQSDVMVVCSATDDVRFENNPLVTGDPKIRFYAGAPLMTADGHALGTLCVMDYEPRTLTQGQTEALQTLAGHVVAQLELSRRFADQERLSMIMEATEDGVWEWRPDTGESFFSPQWKRMLGYEDHEMPSRSEEWSSRVHPDDVEAATEAFVAHFEQPNSTHHIQYRMRHRDGSWRWWHSRGRASHDRHGNLMRAVGTNTDITAHMQARERTDHLLAVGAALGSALTTGDVAESILTAAMPIFQATAATVALLDAGARTLCTIRLKGIDGEQTESYAEFSIDTPSPLADAVREQRLVIVPSKSDPAEYLVAVPLLAGGRSLGGLSLKCPAERCRDDDQATFLWTLANQCSLALERARLYDNALHEAKIRRQAQDALQESDARKSAMLEAALDCIITIDADELVLEWNPACERTFGYSRAETIGRPLSDLIIPPYMRSGHEHGIAHYHATGEGPVLNKRVEVMGMRKDGSELPLELTAVPIKVGGRTMFTAYLRDLTERKQLEEERERALRAAEERADRDPLTGLLNHRAFHKRLEEEAARVEREGSSLTIVMMDLDNFKFFNDVYGHTVGDDVLRQVAKRLQSICRSYDSIARFGGDEFALLMPSASGTPTSELEARLRTDLDDIVFCPDGHTMNIPITVSFGVAALSQLDMNWHETVRLADERLRRAKTGGAAETEADHVRALMSGRVDGFSMLDALVNAVDNKDRYTRRHSEDVMLYSVMIAEELGLSDVEKHTVAVSALLHDVGKIGVPDAVLRKPGKLTDAEFETIRQHPMMGAIMVSAAHGLEDTLDAVRHHHERWDGLGYPFGLKGEDCPLIARLMAVADAYSAMTTDRPYRKGMPRVIAEDILAAGAGTQWDPKCVQAFLRALKRDEACVAV